MTDPQALVRQFPWLEPDRTKKPPYDKLLWPLAPRIVEGRTELPIIGSDAFRARIEAILAELREYLPHRYREVLDFLPQAAHHPLMTHPDGEADSGGWFRNDGSSSLSFLRMALHHETGHNVEYVYTRQVTELGANAYAEYVAWELDRAKAGASGHTDIFDLPLPPSAADAVAEEHYARWRKENDERRADSAWLRATQKAENEPKQLEEDNRIGELLATLMTRGC